MYHSNDKKVKAANFAAFFYKVENVLRELCRLLREFRPIMLISLLWTYQHIKIKKRILNKGIRFELYLLNATSLAPEMRFAPTYRLPQ